MVEIKHEHGQAESVHEDDYGKYRLLYSKSKVYVHPTAYSRDNIPGFVALVRRVSSQANLTICWLWRFVEGRGKCVTSSRMDTRITFKRTGKGRVGEICENWRTDWLGCGRWRCALWTTTSCPTNKTSHTRYRLYWPSGQEARNIRFFGSSHSDIFVNSQPAFLVLVACVVLINIYLSYADFP